jgi:Ni/Co efflux regulator RcnB
MKNIMIVSALVLSIAGMSTAQADPQWHGQNNQNNSSDSRGDQRGDHRSDNHGYNRGNDQGNRHDNHDRGDRHDNGNRYDNHDRHDNGNRYDHYNRGHHYGWNGQRYHAPTRYVRPHGYQVRTWRSGDHLPTNYRTRQYYVDYRQYNLNPPPRGYQYVRVNNDVILTAIATGVIASVIAGLYY